MKQKKPKNKTYKNSQINVDFQHFINLEESEAFGIHRNSNSVALPRQNVFTGLIFTPGRHKKIIPNNSNLYTCKAQIGGFDFQDFVGEQFVLLMLMRHVGAIFCCCYCVALLGKYINAPIRANFLFWLI